MTDKTSKLKVGDKIWWKGAWGKEKSKLVKVKHIEKTKRMEDKYGV